jgi:predicted metal-dependent peptidase
MSDEKLPTNKISEQDKQRAIQSAIYYLTSSQPFYGGLLQELVMKFTNRVPTAGITFNKNMNQYEIHINPDFFCNLSTNQRVAVLHHEILHFTNKHLFRLPFLSASEEDRSLYNMAGDMAINQYITDLPEGCIDVKDWNCEVGNPPTLEGFPKLQSMETYYELLKDNQKNNKEQHNKYKPFDEHDWEKLDEDTKQKMLEEARKVLNRTIEKTSFSHTSIPDSIKDLLSEIEVMSAKINYKQILKQVIKRKVSASDRENTWKRPNKRYGIAAPGTRVGMLPKLSMFVDTSGSISHIEMNQFLDIISGFLKAGSRECQLILWHTSIYSKKKFRLMDKVVDKEIESGGTDINCVLQEIKISNPNLSIILTDGYYESSSIKPDSEIIWVISKGGNIDHPLKNLGKTVLLEGINNE